MGSINADRAISPLVIHLVTVDPVGLAPTFLSLTHGLSRC
jgi:small neutral amino acid transporter SnatA (MarC family)